MRVPGLLLCALLLTTGAGATEKYWTVHEARLIVVGTIHQSATFPWFDGWHIWANIDVDETLFGPRVPRRIAYRFVCRWDQLCRSWPPPRLEDFNRGTAIWLLRPADNQTWSPSLGGIDPGFWALSGRADVENYIRRYKH
jgi:hypothetical protein